ncbi:MAG: M13 family metallopeptidase [Eubacterium sp.]|nr:M13 family metallopeptidase [Eubacterium sp.]
MKKKLRTAICAVTLTMSLTACSMGEMLGYSSNWVDSDLIGSVPADEEFSVKDDFAAAVNQAWKNEMGDTFRGTFQDVDDAVTANKKRIVTDESIEGETAECLRTYYALASNWDDRNADKVEPLRPYIEDIESISSMDEMYDFIADPVRNPLFLGPITTNSNYVMHTEVYKDNYTLFFTMPDLTLGGMQGNDAYFSLDSKDGLEAYIKGCDKSKYILEQLGYSEEEAEKEFEGCVAWEKKLASHDELATVEKMDDITYPRDEVIEMAGKFPMEKILEGWGLNDAPYIAIDPSYAESLNSLCKKSNLDDIKSFMIVNYCLKSSAYLDRDTYDQMVELQKSKVEEEKDYGKTDEDLENNLMFNRYIGGTPMVGAMNQVYVENCFDESTIDELTTITQDLLDGFEDIFSEEEWLSEEGKKACIEKLKAIKIHIAVQDFDTVDYGTLDLKSHEEGGNFLEAYFAAQRFEMDHIGWLTAQDYDRDYWDPLNQQLSTTITNAMYSAQTNGIYIFAGILEAPVYSKDMTYEEKLGGLFAVVGHEITHGFDKNGSQYDKEGFNNPILSEDDQKAFNDKDKLVGGYYTLQTPFSGAGMILGQIVSAEATADMGGIRATLHLAEKESDFNYDLYFRTYATIWRINVDIDSEKDSIASDEHPLAFYRVNIGLQQFDEFYETYGITEGDGMYLAPKSRIKVW